MPRIIIRGSGDPEARKKALFSAHRQVVHYLATLEFLRLVTLKFEGKPSDQPCIVVANHPSLLDFIVLLHDLPNAVCLYKAKSRNNPVLGSFVKVGGYIEGMDGGNARSTKRIITTTCKRLAEGHQVAFFPEGTRSKSTLKIGKFRTPAFHAAIRSQVAVQPIAILCQPRFLGKNQKWIEFSLQKNLMVIRYLPLVKIEDLPKAEQTASGLAQAVQNKISIALNEMSVAATKKRKQTNSG